jgi:cell division protein FtsW (lipid II flippase)
LWDFLFYLSFGFVITVTVGTAGVLLVFVFLVAPAVLATLVTDHLGRQILVGWALGIVATVSGLIVSYVADLSSGPVVVGAYAVVLITAAIVVHIVRAPHRTRALRNTGIAAALFVLAIGTLLIAGKRVGAGFHGHRHGEEMHADDPVADPSSGSETTGIQADRMSEFERRFDQEADAAGQVIVVLQALESDGAIGASLAIRFLEASPPLFYRESVVSKLDSLMSRPTGFSITDSPNTMENQRALSRVRSEFDLAEDK